MPTIHEPPPTAIRSNALPRLVVRDPVGIPLNTDTGYQRRIHEARQRQAGPDGHRSMADGDWRLPHSLLPSRPDYSRTLPPMASDNTARRKAMRNARSQDPGMGLMSAIEDEYSKEYQQLRWSIQQAGTLPALTGSALIHEHGARVTAGRSYLPFVGIPPIVHRNLSETDVRHREYPVPLPCAGCARLPAILCYGCERDSSPHFHYNKPVRTGGGFTYLRRDQPLNVLHQKNPINWKVSIGEPFSYVFFDGLVYPDLEKYRLTMRITRYPTQTPSFSSGGHSEVSDVTQLDEAERKRRLREVLAVMDGKHLSMFLAKFKGKSTTEMNNGKLQKRSTEDGDEANRRLQHPIDIDTGGDIDKRSESNTGIGSFEFGDGGDAETDACKRRKSSLYKTPKPFKIKERERKSIEARSPFSTERTYDYDLGQGFNIKRSEKKLTEFDEIERGDDGWKEPDAFKLKSRDEFENELREKIAAEEGRKTVVSLQLEHLSHREEDADDEEDEEEEEEVEIEGVEEAHREGSEGLASRHSEVAESRASTPDSGVGSVRLPDFDSGIPSATETALSEAEQEEEPIPSPRQDSLHSDPHSSLQEPPELPKAASPPAVAEEEVEELEEEDVKKEEIPQPPPPVAVVKEDLDKPFIKEVSKVVEIKEVIPPTPVEEVIEKVPDIIEKKSHSPPVKKEMKAATKRDRPKKHIETPEPPPTKQSDKDSTLGTDYDTEVEGSVDMSFIREHTLPSPPPVRYIDPPPLPKAEPPAPPKIPLYTDPEKPKRAVSQTQIESPPTMTEPPKQRRPPPSFKPKRKPRERKKAPIIRAQPAHSAKKEIKEFANPLDYLAKYCIIHPERLPYYERVFTRVVAEQMYRYLDIPDENGKYASFPGAGVEDNLLQTSKEDEQKKSARAKDREQVKTRLTEKERNTIDGYTMISHHMQPEYGTAGMNEGDQAVKKINFTLDSLIDKYENLHERLDTLMMDRVQHIAGEARKVFPEINRADWSPTKKKRKKSPKRKKDSKKDSKQDNKLVTHLSSSDEARGLDTSRTSGPPTDLDVVNRMDKKMLQKVDGSRDIALLNVEIQRIQERLRSVDDRIEDLEDEKKLLQLYCRDKYKENQVDEAKPTSFLRRQSMLYQKMHPTMDMEMNLQEVEEALQQINGHLITEKEMQFIFQVLDLPGRRRVNMQLFSAVAALSEKVVQVDPFIKKLLNKLDFEALSVKMDRVKELFYLLDEQDDNVPTGKISSQSLGIELAAGGVSRENTAYVVDKFNREKKGIVDFLDFLIYVPLFIEIHSRIIGNPLDGDRSM